MYIRFNDCTEEKAQSLACKLEVAGNIRYRQLSACQLTYEDNPDDLITVWVAEKPRTAVIEVSKPDYQLGSRFVPVHF